MLDPSFSCCWIDKIQCKNKPSKKAKRSSKGEADFEELVDGTKPYLKVPTGPEEPLALGDPNLPPSKHLDGRAATANNYWSIKVPEPPLERKPKLVKLELHLEITNNISVFQVFTVQREICLNETRSNKHFEPSPNKPLPVVAILRLLILQ